MTVANYKSMCPHVPESSIFVKFQSAFWSAGAI
jgi:hypothetical protein